MTNGCVIGNGWCFIFFEIPKEEQYKTPNMEPINGKGWGKCVYFHYAVNIKQSHIMTGPNQ